MAVVTVLAVVVASLLITRVGAVALMLTGMSRESSRFQARSAFFGVGFTTAEAEAVVGHPVRRRIIAWLILLGNAGVISVLGTLIISFGGHNQDTLLRVVALAGALLVLSLVAASRPVDRILTRLIRRALGRWSDLDVRDYSAVLELEGGYAVAELLVEDSDWIAGRRLAEVTLRDEGVVVLGVRRGRGAYLGAPDGDTIVRAGDVLTLYGREDRVCELDRRARGAEGDAAHEQAVHAQEELEAEEEALDPAAVSPPGASGT
jgi:4-amino-4-deoxy-L-arabinose transferase-like glycosyltransferase